MCVRVRVKNIFVRVEKMCVRVRIKNVFVRVRKCALGLGLMFSSKYIFVRACFR